MHALAKKDYPQRYLVRKCPDQRSGRVMKALCAVYPGDMHARHLMARAGLSWRDEPIHSFVCLCNDLIKINQVLSRHGWQAVRTNGTPDAYYRLSPIGDG